MYHNTSFFADSSMKFPDNARICSIIGSDLAEKGFIIRLIGEIFADLDRQTWYSPFEEKLPQAIYFPKLKTVVQASTDSISGEKLSTKTWDIGSVFTDNMPDISNAADYIYDQSCEYHERSLELLSVAGTLIREYRRSGKELIASAKIRALARETSSLPELGKTSSIINMSFSAVTCNGIRFTEMPDNTQVTLLHDSFSAASDCFIKAAAAEASQRGYDAIISRSFDCSGAPLHLYIPEAGRLFVSDAFMPEGIFKNAGSLSLERYYPTAVISSAIRQNAVLKDCIMRIIAESALCARICSDIKIQRRKLLEPYISTPAAADIAADIVSSILNS